MPKRWVTPYVSRLSHLQSGAVLQTSIPFSIQTGCIERSTTRPSFPFKKHTTFSWSNEAHYGRMFLEDRSLSVKACLWWVEARFCLVLPVDLAAHRCSFVKPPYRKNLLALAIPPGQRVNTQHKKFVIVVAGNGLRCRIQFSI